ncbi:EAL domain-containing protein [Vreelandella sp. EE22]
MHKEDEAARIFRQLAKGAGQSGDPQFYLLLAEKLAQLLKVDHVLVAAYQEDNRAQTLAFWSQGQAKSNISYSLAGTPCESISERTPCVYHQHVQSRFPDDELLETLGVESYTGFPLVASNGELIGFLVVLANRSLAWGEFENDILAIAAVQLGMELERRQNERALKESEQLAHENERRLNTLLDHLPGMAYRCLSHRRWEMEFVSQGAEELSGYSAETLQAGDTVNFDSLIHEKDKAYLFTELEKALARRVPYRVVYRMRHRDGDYRWVCEQGQGVFDSKGQVVCLEGFICDITDQYESQRIHNAVVQVASTVTSRAGDNYFQQLMITLITLLEADAGFIALLDQPFCSKTLLDEPPNERLKAATISTVSLVVQGEACPNQTFHLCNTPSEQVVLQQEAVIQKSAATLLPGTSFHGQAWIGRRLDNAQGEVIGVILVFYQSPLVTNVFATSVLRILSTGASAELERQRDHRHMQYLAYIDTVTGLPNRVRFMELLTSLCEQHYPLAIILLDIHCFKEVNDLHGHSIGDELLATMARRLEEAAGSPSTVARLSSNEFAVLITGGTGSTLAATVTRLHQAVCQPVCLSHLSLNIDVNVGFASYPDTTDSPAEVFNAATMALHHAKRTDENFCVYHQALHYAIQRRQELTERLQAAISEQRLLLFFQPQVNLISGQLTGAEALCRWYDDEWGWISPGEFIPLAEERGLISLLGDWVLGEAARQLSAWENAQTPLPGRLSVNVSAQQFADPKLPEHVARLTQGVPSHSIGLELTESDFMRNPDQAVASTLALRQAGFSISIDDFGTGYSSLSYLRRFAADVLKIDISFVRHMVDNRHDRAIVQTIIGMADTLEIKPLAEGVESEAQASLLAQMGCREAQGHWLGKPVCAETFARQWLAPGSPVKE